MEGGIGDELSVQLEGMACSCMFYRRDGEEKRNRTHHGTPHRLLGGRLLSIHPDSDRRCRQRVDWRQ